MQSSHPDKPKVTITPYPETADWDWPEESQKEWRELVGKGEEYVAFYRYWSSSGARSNFSDTFPYKLSLGGGSSISPGGKPILVTDAYDKMLHRLSRLRENDRKGGRIKGAVITGQPGIGKTTFQKFMLAQLISTQEVVLLCDSYKILLFFRGRVYHRSTNSGFDFLPTPPITLYYPIWALVDVGLRQEPPITESSYIWPVQTSSPNPIRWRDWSKHNKAALLGMPLWSMEELSEGLLIQPEYDNFREQLESRIRTSTTSSDPVYDEQITAALDVFRMEVARLTEVAAAADRDKGIAPMTVDGEAQPLPQPGTVDLVFALLMRNATEEFGFAPRDVYGGVFDFPEVKGRHVNKLKTLDYNKLMSLSETFSQDCVLDDLSHHVVAVNPREDIPRRDRWTIDFKSPRIAREVVGLMLSIEHRHLRETYRLLHGISSGMAGTIFESIAHRVLYGNDVPQSTAMTSDRKTPPTFTAPASDGKTPPTLTAPASGSGTTPAYKRVKDYITIDFLHDLHNVTTESDRYYVPTSATNPLFDSFTVTFDPSKHAAVVSIFQIMTSREHGGSAEGYPLIRKIIARARTLLNCSQNADISVKYILVCPEDGSQHRWTMPEGWNEGNLFNNQIGEGFCIHIPSHYLK